MCGCVECGKGLSWGIKKEKARESRKGVQGLEDRIEPVKSGDMEREETGGVWCLYSQKIVVESERMLWKNQVHGPRRQLWKAQAASSNHQKLLERTRVNLSDTLPRHALISPIHIPRSTAHSADCQPRRTISTLTSIIDGGAGQPRVL